MAPTICMPEHVISRQEKASPYICRRRFQFKRDLGHEPNTASGRSTLVLQNSPAWRSKCPPDSSLSDSYFKERDGSCKDQLARREGLLNIIFRTISLMRRNHLLQQKVDALRTETQEFINSVMNNTADSDAEESNSSSFEDSENVLLISSSTQEEQTSDDKCTNDEVSNLSSSTDITSSDCRSLQSDY